MLGRKPKQYFRGFWALNNVSFEIKKGETVGIIGRNGSGKSTLLQLICGTLNPTSGSVQTNGRIAALLELGSGFNPEFTGRENIYLNASVLGLSKKEIDDRFDDIVAFADVGDFIEQPVKTYSSGMVVRVAFAVIAHVDADILVIDEALSVGDAVFQQKCMRFLRKFMEQGTVLFVSHDSGSIVNLCQHAIWLNKGTVSKAGITKQVVEAYTQFTLQEIYGDDVRLTSVNNIKSTSQEKEKSQVADVTFDKETSIAYFTQLNKSGGWETGKAKILSVRLMNNDGQVIPMLHGGELVNLEIIAIANESVYSPILGWFVNDRLGQPLFGEHTYTYVNPPMLVNAGEQIKAVFQFQMPLLPNGEYAMTVSIAEGDPFEHTQHHWLHDVVVFKVVSNKLRYGLVGIAFQSVSFNKI
ncbi:ABC transporter ATP-binding protein [Methyloglobulus morosus]|uniref:ABC transporter ATP-binding protein n=1 Tax=Methyloglobulus morosus TaxID=1410681 RepID=UPI001F383372|nr:ABC transporter ATP-binding protein [Methyloglobulus morosus]